LRLDHLNKEKAIHVYRIINKYSDLFRLSDELLGHTDVNANKIVTIDDKQYRFPAFDKDEINKQVKDLMMSDVIKPSNSP